MAKDKGPTREELVAARDDLERIAKAERKAGRRGETDAILAANDRVAALEDSMPSWKKVWP